MYFNIYLLVAQMYIITMIDLTEGYVLLAANMDDFKSIARKFVPEKLVNQLAELASKSSTNNPPIYKQRHSSDNDEEESKLSAVMRRDKDGPRLTKVNFEELVERVKLRLQQDSAANSKLTKNTVQSAGKNIGRDFYRPQNKIVVTERPTTELSHKVSQPKKVVRKPLKAEVNIPDIGNSKQSEDYSNDPEAEIYKLIHGAQVEKEQIEKEDDNLPFAKVDMLKKHDSYEDYVTPAKEENIFESGPDEATQTSKRFPVRKPKIQVRVQKSKAVKYESKTPKADDADTKKDIIDVIVADEEIPLEDAKDFREYVTVTENEIKAQTGDLNYDYEATNSTNDYEEITTPIAKATKKKSGTMFPKRDYNVNYKMSSPNYVAKIPVVAEKYNFDEPLPFRDQEPENLKRLLPILPSIINGKVRYSK